MSKQKHSYMLVSVITWYQGGDTRRDTDSKDKFIKILL